MSLEASGWPHRVWHTNGLQINMTFMILFFASVWAGAQNALAGGGSFITLPLLILSGMNPRAANITSTIALFPGQVASGWTGRQQAQGGG